MNERSVDSAGAWPELVVDEWRDTYATLHLWTQIVGKIQLRLTPLVNHWWNAALHLSSRGLTTAPMHDRGRLVEIEFDFIDHTLRIHCSHGSLTTLPLRSISVAAFHRELFDALRALGIEVAIWTMPVELPTPWSIVREAIPFERDEVHRTYDPDAAFRFWQALVSADTLFKEFRCGFLGKSSPAHFWWGSFDHAVTRFSGRPAPPREGADRIQAEAYSHEVISHGFWPGGNGIEAVFYAYAAPEPAGFASATVEPAEAYYSTEMGEFLLPYNAARRAESPEDAVTAFLRSTYEAAATLAGWDRAALER